MKGPYFGTTLSALQKLGIFTCKQIFNIENDRVFLHPSKGWIQSICYGFTCITTFTLFGLGFVVACNGSQKPITVSEVANTYFNSFSFSTSNFDANVFASLLFCLIFMHFTFFILLNRSKVNYVKRTITLSLMDWI